MSDDEKNTEEGIFPTGAPYRSIEPFDEEISDSLKEISNSLKSIAWSLNKIMAQGEAPDTGTLREKE